MQQQNAETYQHYLKTVITEYHILLDDQLECMSIWETVENGEQEDVCSKKKDEPNWCHYSYLFLYTYPKWWYFRYAVNFNQLLF